MGEGQVEGCQGRSLRISCRGVRVAANAVGGRVASVVQEGSVGIKCKHRYKMSRCRSQRRSIHLEEGGAGMEQYHVSNTKQ